MKFIRKVMIWNKYKKWLKYVSQDSHTFETLPWKVEINCNGLAVNKSRISGMRCPCGSRSPVTFATTYSVGWYHYEATPRIMFNCNKCFYRVWTDSDDVHFYDHPMTHRFMQFLSNDMFWEDTYDTFDRNDYISRDEASNR